VSLKPMIPPARHKAAALVIIRTSRPAQLLRFDVIVSLSSAVAASACALAVYPSETYPAPVSAIGVSAAAAARGARPSAARASFSVRMPRLV